MPRRRVHYVLSTHWDREWYRPAQHYRHALVALLDGVIAALEDGRLAGPFTCDGQAILLEDYLEARPERRGRVEALARAGMLVVGPWYTQPDEFLVSGESLVRNLRLGRRVARELGAAPSSAGWVCDQFGHVGQLPQIFAGFGIGAALLWRGTNYAAARHFRWAGADGTTLPAYRFGKGGYCGFAFAVRHADEPARALDEEQIWADLEAYLAAEAAATAVPPVLAVDGGDHLAWDERVGRVIQAYGRRAEEPFELVHSSLDAYVAELLPHVASIAHTIRGELREPAGSTRTENEHWLIPGVLSSRVPLKQENAACESLLTHWAEPLCAWASLALGREYPRGLLDIAWRWLLQNHPHDSMGGCSVDQVHADMAYRFSQCRQIAALLADEAARALALAAGAPGPDELRVTVFNPLPRPLAETVELTLDIPRGWPPFAEFFGFEPKPAFRLFGPGGAELPYQRLGQELGAPRTRVTPLKFPQGYAVDAVRLSLPLEIPPLGFVTLTARPGTIDPLLPHQAPRPIALPTRHPGRGLATGERSMANEHVAVTVEPDGTLTLTDRATGAVYPRLLTFEDGADIGDGWFHGPAVADELYTSAGAPAAVALVHDGPFLTTFRVRVAMRVPARFAPAAGRRSDELVELHLDSLVSLRPGARRVEVETTLRNSAEDHRLRVLFPTGAAAASYLSDGAFDVVERPVALRADNHLLRELEVEGKPQQSWTAVEGGGRGLVVVTAGLLESAVRDLPERPIVLTLLRSTRRTVLTRGEPGGLHRGETLCYRMWIAPLAGPPDRAALCDLGRQLAAGVRCVQLTADDVAVLMAGGAAAAAGADVDGAPGTGFLAVDGAAVLTSAALAGDSLEVRLFNPNDEPLEAALHPPAGVSLARRVDLDGAPLEEPRPLADGAVPLSLAPKQILTLRLS